MHLLVLKLGNLNSNYKDNYQNVGILEEKLYKATAFVSYERTHVLLG